MNHLLRSCSERIVPGAVLLCAVLLSLAGTVRVQAQPVDLILPTGNTAIFDGNDSLFYQQTATSRAQPWNGGRFGFVRNPRETREGRIYTRYHEGIDIRPLYRDEQGRPLDSVVAVADGRVVHANSRAGRSNYGNYIVVEHIWNGAPYYSLYAHLGEVWVDSGQDIRQGALLGRLGYTGAGINRSRAHLHFEITLLLNDRFHDWFDHFYHSGSNHHGCYNGMNLAGLDVARLYLALRGNPDLTIEEFLAEENPYFEVAVPITERPGLLSRYPWMLKRRVDTADRCWKIAFTSYGLPLSVEPSPEEAADRRVVVAQPSALSYKWLTKSIVAGHDENCSLSESGRRYIELMLMETRESRDLPAATAGAEEEMEDAEEN